MTTPKAPDSNQDWEGIDIFLFSNGQQYSPPRKYHLRLYELHWWENTLNFLGRCQYGSSQTSSIDLYTTDGFKVSSPMELSNGVAYVAVKPPDAFIDAGYEHYLVKASKSWERRQSKKTDQIKLPSGELLNKSEKSKTDSNKYAVGNKIPDRRTNVMTTDESVRAEHKLVLTKPDKTKMITDAKHSTQQSTVNAIKIVERRKPNSGQPAQRTATVMKKPIVRPVTPSLAGKSPLQKGQPLKGNLKGIPVKTNEKDRSTIKSKTSKVIDVVTHLPYTVFAKTDETDSEVKIVASPSEKKTTVSSNKVLTESVRMDNVIENKDLNIDGLSNQGQMEGIRTDNVIEDKDVQITVLSNQGQIEDVRIDNAIKDDVNLSVLDNQSKNKSDRTNNIIEEKDIKITVSSNSQGQIESIRIDNVNEEKDLIAISDIYPNTTESESISMLVDAENLPGVVYNILTREQNRQSTNSTNLATDKKQKFSPIIEEQAVMFQAIGDTAHASNTVATNDPPKKDPDSPQTTHLSSAHKSSEHIIATVIRADSINLKLDIKVTNGDTMVSAKETNNINRSQSLIEVTKQNEIYKIEPSKSMQSLTTEVPHVSCPKYRKIVIMQCSCQDQCKNEPKPIVQEKTTYFIVLPIATQDEKQSCSKNENEQCKHNRSVNSTADKDVQVPEPPIGVSFVRTDKDNYTQNSKNTEDGEVQVQDLEKNDNISTTSKVVFIDHPGDQTEYVEFEQISQSSVRSTTTVQKPEYLVRRKSIPKTDSFTKLFRDVSTQSEWCNVLLEAKRHEDGRYSFHLPPLYLLSRYRV